jgi:Cytochrome P460
MNINPLLALVAATLFAALSFRGHSAPPAQTTASNAPSYTDTGELRFPQNYREWVFLSTGIDMSYNPAMSMDHHMFDNVFVNPEAYQSFVKTGTWPDKTIFVLEARGAESKESINKAGLYQGPSVMGLEIHIKDESRFPGKWAFFGFDDGKLGKIFPTSASCYSCHEQHAAVDTTFVQFYPTLLPIATSKHTLSDAYVKEFQPAQKSTHK